MPEIIATPHALVQTNSGKRFYVFSGEIAVSGETTMIDIDNIGERDIKVTFELGTGSVTSADCIQRVKSNGIVIYHNETTQGGTTGQGYNELKLVLPANTSLTFTLEQSGSYIWTIAGYGKFV
jgi:hypothetical protein